MEIKDDNARKEVGPKESLVTDILIRVEEDYLLSILASDFVGGHVYEILAVFCKEATRRFFFLTDEEVNEEAFADLFGSNEGNDIEVGVGFVQC